MFCIPGSTRSTSANRDLLVSPTETSNPPTFSECVSKLGQSFVQIVSAPFKPRPAVTLAEIPEPVLAGVLEYLNPAPTNRVTPSERARFALASKSLNRIRQEQAQVLRISPTNFLDVLQKLNSGAYKKLRSVTVSGNLNNEQVKQLSEQLNNQPFFESLTLHHCQALTELPNKLPSTTKQLRVVECHNLNRLPASLPENLIELNLAGSHGLRALPDSWPASLRKLDLSRCDALTEIPSGLPTQMTHLNLANCTQIRTLNSGLPTDLRSLNLKGCRSITQYP